MSRSLSDWETLEMNWQLSLTSRMLSLSSSLSQASPWVSRSVSTWPMFVVVGQLSTSAQTLSLSASLRASNGQGSTASPMASPSASLSQSTLTKLMSAGVEPLLVSVAHQDRPALVVGRSDMPAETWLTDEPSVTPALLTHDEPLYLRYDEPPLTEMRQVTLPWVAASKSVHTKSLGGWAAELEQMTAWGA